MSRGLDVGYWTSGCEAWFQKRLASIKSNNAQPFTAAQWKSNLKFNTRTPKLVDMNMWAARRFMEGTL
jgi:hypothetical protein